MKSTVTRRALICALLPAALVLAAIGAPSTTVLEITAYNHTDQGVGSYSVSTPGGDRVGAGYLDAGAGGGGYTCCISVPSVWRPGLAVTVSYVTIVNNAKKTLVHVVSIPQYDTKTANTMIVHFLRNGDVKVFVTGIMLGHRDYPLKGKEAELTPGIPIKIRWP